MSDLTDDDLERIDHQLMLKFRTMVEDEPPVPLLKPHHPLKESTKTGGNHLEESWAVQRPQSPIKEFEDSQRMSLLFPEEEPPNVLPL